MFPKLDTHIVTIDADVVGKAIESHALFDSIGRVFNHFLRVKSDTVKTGTVRNIAGVCREGSAQCFQAAWLLDDFAAKYVALPYRGPDA